MIDFSNNNYILDKVINIDNNEVDILSIYIQSDQVYYLTIENTERKIYKNNICLYDNLSYKVDNFFIENDILFLHERDSTFDNRLINYQTNEVVINFTHELNKVSSNWDNLIISNISIVNGNIHWLMYTTDVNEGIKEARYYYYINDYLCWQFQPLFRDSNDNVILYIPLFNSLLTKTSGKNSSLLFKTFPFKYIPHRKTPLNFVPLKIYPTSSHSILWKRRGLWDYFYEGENLIFKGKRELHIDLQMKVLNITSIDQHSNILLEFNDNNCAYICKYDRKKLEPTETPIDWYKIK